MTDQRCLTFAIARRSALTAEPSYSCVPVSSCDLVDNTTTYYTVRGSKKLNIINIINFQKWYSMFSKSCHYVALFEEFVDTPVNDRPSIFRIDSVHHMETSTFCWSINTKSMSMSCPPTLIPLSGVGTTCFSSCCDKDSTIIFTTGRLPDVNPPWNWSGCIKPLVPIANATGTNGLTCLPKHGEDRDNKFWSPILRLAIETGAYLPRPHAGRTDRSTIELLH
jgi:hypothetical protein